MINKTTLTFEQIESIAMALSHVVGVSDGITPTGDAVVRILIDCPTEQFDLPDTLIACDIVLDYIGNIRAE
ncbi:hypothetical protein [Agaribacter marinus]|uniref:Uncharacterized protein n=1 Tax=Agaribacter marinus TaxID=1431249 RepID=A0AA37WHZ5_9ALTE|nr:hypothetical protein [Agaribacter marinus]GLR70247.1 hypothetical protein GCM10007852_11550 [Agaribacter marinus]